MKVWRVLGFYPYTHLAMIERDDVMHWWLGRKYESNFISDEDTHHVVDREWAIRERILDRDGKLKREAMVRLYAHGKFKYADAG